MRVALAMLACLTTACNMRQWAWNLPEYRERRARATETIRERAESIWTTEEDAEAFRAEDFREGMTMGGARLLLQALDGTGVNARDRHGDIEVWRVDGWLASRRSLWLTFEDGRLVTWGSTEGLW